MIYITVLLLSFFFVLFLIPKIVLVSAKKKLLDIPNERKVHKRNSSRLGGVTFFPSIFFTIYVVVAFYSLIDDSFSDGIASIWWLFGVSACFLMYSVGVADDISEVRYRTKFFYQIVASLLIVSSGTWMNNLFGIFGIDELPLWIGIPFSIVLLVFIMNAINLIDGIDGLASGLAIVALSFYGVLFFHRGLLLPTLICIATIGALAGFFRYNVFGLPNKSTKIFMGDAGTLLIGTIIGLLALRLLSQNNRFNTFVSHTDLIIAYSVLIIPCFDVIRVMLHRCRIKKPLFQPDKNHIHHRLLAAGYNHEKTLILILCFSTGITVLNMLMSYIVRLECVILLDVVIYTYVNILISNRINKSSKLKQKHIMYKQVCMQLFLWAAFVFISTSCATSKKVIYFQGEQIGVTQKVSKGDYITIQPQDQLSIVVSSKDPELAVVFNLPRAAITIGAQQTGITNPNSQILAYTVNDCGDIDFPVLGNIHVQGLARQQVASLIKSKLSEDLVKDAVVTVDFVNLAFSVMGEVTKPGKYAINRDQITILEALSMAGDLTITGQRDRVLLIRTKEGERITYKLDLRFSDIFNSPAYYVQQNDVIYVEPNSVRANQSTVNGNSARSVSLWMSIASFLTTIGVLIFK